MSFLVLIQIICDAVALLTINISSSISLSASGVIFPIAFAIIAITANINGAERAKRVAIVMTIAQFIFCITVYLFATLKTHDNRVTENFHEYFHLYWSVTSAGILDTFYTTMLISAFISIDYIHNKFWAWGWCQPFRTS